MKPLALSLATPIVAALASTAAHSQSPFNAPVFPLDAPAEPVDFGVADLDGDGLSDTVVLSSNPTGPFVGRVEVFTTGPDGFASTQLLDSVRGASSPAFGDLDGDGDTDLVIGSDDPGHQRVRIYLNAGDGTLVGPTLAFVGPSPGLVALADIDADGVLDVVAGLVGSDELAVCIGDGVGGFAPPALLHPLSATPLALDVGDLDGDGWLDVVVGLTGTGLSVHLGDGAGELGPGSVTSDGSEATGLALIDTSGDGILDLVRADAAGEVRIVPGDGDGGFGSPTVLALPFNALPDGPPTIEPADVDGDGVQDVLVFGGYAYLLRGVAGGGLEAPVELTANVAPYLVRVRVGELTGDGEADLLVLRTQDDLSLLVGDGEGGFHFPERRNLDDLHQLVVADVTGDGLQDVVVARRRTPSITVTEAVTVIAGDGDRGFGSSASYSLGIGANGVDAGDLDGDGYNDIVATSFERSKVGVLMGTGNGFPSAPVEYPALAGYQIRLGDLNGDGHLDAVYGTFQNLATLKGNGTGSLLLAQQTPTDGLAFDLELADFDLDGNLDVLAEASFDGAAILWGGPTTAFGPSQLIEDLSSYVNGLAVTDLDRDGLPEPVVATTNSGRLYVWENLGARQFGPGQFWQLGNSGGVTTGDFDGDGNADLFHSGFEWSLLRGDGLGGLEPVETLDSLTTSTEILQAADWSGGGRTDVFVVGRDHLSQEGVYVVPNLVGDPAGTERFGASTPGCDGLQGLAASASVSPGDTLRVTTTQAPPASFGVLLFGTGADLAGTDLLGLGAALHVDLLGSFAKVKLLVSDVTGNARVDLPIPSDPIVEGIELHTQTLWGWGVPCAGNPAGYSATNGLTVTILP